MPRRLRLPLAAALLPCTARTGIGFPLANGPTSDSGELGTGPAGFRMEGL